MVNYGKPPLFIMRLDLEDTIYKQLKTLKYKVEDTKGKKVWFGDKPYNLKYINTPKLVSLFDIMTEKHNIKWDWKDRPYMTKYIEKHRS